MGLTKEQLKKDQERDANIANIMAQLELPTKHVINRKYMNTIGSSSGVTFDGVPFEDTYTEEVNSLGNQTVGSQLAFPRPPGN